jgi:DNA-binding helix-hairpin-helix protein with protein kinase domain
MYRVYDINDRQQRIFKENISIDPMPLHENGNTAIIHETNFRHPRRPDTSYVAKLYRRHDGGYYLNHYGHIEEKLKYMVRTKLNYIGRTKFAWPEFLIYETVEAGNEVLVGFLMQYVTDYHTVADGIQHFDDKNTRWLLAHKVASAIATLHDGQICIGDLHPGNLLVKQQENHIFQLVFIDCDSYTIINPVGTTIVHDSPLRPSGCYILIEHPQTSNDVYINDRHATAHILFELLVGRNPYKAMQHHMKDEDLLKNRRFPYTDRRFTAHQSDKQAFNQLPIDLQKLFTHAFSSRDKIPTPSEFSRAIRNALVDMLI